MTSSALFKRMILALLWRIDSERARGPEERPVRRLQQHPGREMVEAESWEDVWVKSG